MTSSVRSFNVLVIAVAFVLSVTVHGELSASSTFAEFVLLCEAQRDLVETIPSKDGIGGGDALDRGHGSVVGNSDGAWEMHHQRRRLSQGHGGGRRKLSLSHGRKLQAEGEDANIGIVGDVSRTDERELTWPSNPWEIQYQRRRLSQGYGGGRRKLSQNGRKLAETPTAGRKLSQHAHANDGGHGRRLSQNGRKLSKTPPAGKGRKLSQGRGGRKLAEMVL